MTLNILIVHKEGRQLKSHTHRRPKCIHNSRLCCRSGFSYFWTSPLKLSHSLFMLQEDGLLKQTLI